MYAMVCTRLDLSHVVSMESRYMHDPRRGHWEAMRWILRCIKGIGDVELFLGRMLLVSRSAQVM